jgi:hypothetical protein
MMRNDLMGYTADHFSDVEKLELGHRSFWPPKLAPGRRTFQVMLVNDGYTNASGLTLTLGNARAEAPFQVAALGQTTMYVDLDVPNIPGDYLLQAKAGTTLSRRKVVITPKP